MHVRDWNDRYREMASALRRRQEVVVGLRGGRRVQGRVTAVDNEFIIVAGRRCDREEVESFGLEDSLRG